jgi:hypothetical protein
MGAISKNLLLLDDFYLEFNILPSGWKKFSLPKRRLTDAINDATSEEITYFSLRLRKDFNPQNGCQNSDDI